MTQRPKTFIYKILSQKDWHLANQLGHTKTALDEGDGYVHLSTRAQVGETLKLHYKNQSSVQLLEYVLEHISGDIRWEESRGGQLFPHLYGTLRVDAAKRVWPLKSGEDGICLLPADIDP